MLIDMVCSECMITNSIVKTIILIPFNFISFLPFFFSVQKSLGLGKIVSVQSQDVPPTSKRAYGGFYFNVYGLRLNIMHVTHCNLILHLN